MVKEHKFSIFHLVNKVGVYHEIFLVTLFNESCLSIINFRVLKYWVFAVFGDLVELILFLYVSYKCLYSLEILAIFVLIIYIFAHLLLHRHSFEQLFGRCDLLLESSFNFVDHRHVTATESFKSLSLLVLQ